jgi:hypothetical protein
VFGSNQRYSQEALSAPGRDRPGRPVVAPLPDPYPIEDSTLSTPQVVTHHLFRELRTSGLEPIHEVDVTHPHQAIAAQQQAIHAGEHSHLDRLRVFLQKHPASRQLHEMAAPGIIDEIW